MAALGFAGLQKLIHALIIASGFTVNAVVYGAFSAIPRISGLALTLHGV